MRFLLRSSGLIFLLIAICASARAQTGPAPAAAPQVPGVTMQIPGVPYSPTISIPVPGLPAAAPAPAAVPGPPVAAQPAGVAVPLPGVPGSPTVTVPTAGAPAQQPPPAAAGPAPKPVAPAAASPPPPVVPKPSIAELSFVIDANVNPDASGRPSPVLVRIYELRSVAAFNRGDFFALFEREKEHLAAELVAREELPLMPGASPQAITTLRGDTRYLGVIAAFRDIERAQWRASTPIFVNQTTRMEIKLDRNQIAIKLQ